MDQELPWLNISLEVNLWSLLLCVTAVGPELPDEMVTYLWVLLLFLIVLKGTQRINHSLVPLETEK